MSGKLGRAAAASMSTSSSSTRAAGRASADSVLLAAFRELGALPPAQEKEDEEKTALAQLGAEDLVRCVAAALRRVQGQDAVSEDDAQLEGNLMQKHRACAKLATAVKALGYTRECGYNTLLYPSDERATRDLLSFLADQCAKANADFGHESRSENGSELNASAPKDLKTRMQNALRAWNAETWTLQAPGSRARARPFETIQRSKCYHAPLSEAFANTSQRDRLSHVEVCTLIERNRLDALRARLREQYGLDLPHPQDISMATSTEDAPQNIKTRMGPPIPPRPQRNKSKGDELADNDAEASSERSSSSIRTKLEDEQDAELTTEDRIVAIHAALQEVNRTTVVSEKEAIKLLRLAEEETAEAREMESLESDYAEQVALQREILEALPGCPGNLEALEAQVGTLTEKERAAAHARSCDHEEIRAQIAQVSKQQQEARDNVERRAQEATRLSAEIRKLEQVLRSQHDEAHTFDDGSDSAASEMVEGHEAFVARIMDIVGQVRRQSDEISRVIADVRRVQGDMSRTSEKLRRAEAAADELIFTISETRPRDPTGPRAYKLLHDMRILFDDLVDIARRTGKAANRARDMDSRAANLRSMMSETQMDQVNSDLVAIRAENALLLERQAAAQAQGDVVETAGGARAKTH
ncbi:Coiled-coil domain-containing protein 22 [Hondaea fermentalgiana]|uniref:Coiled-coil domain-containing protein 22 n=1 Tax=Hondaea fermentalgiana TaxID=2315210 RepID=A0A2R5G484_9STRA|nr:Coiled-coil domain-containing protein 22 [Hondaea fermentalgiana]|eukprot:GBG25365.1 Coiled-coil domain-containing protein 22 [Hondaea fermentalgiana]